MSKRCMANTIFARDPQTGTMRLIPTGSACCYDAFYEVVYDVDRGVYLVDAGKQFIENKFGREIYVKCYEDKSGELVEARFLEGYPRFNLCYYHLDVLFDHQDNETMRDITFPYGNVVKVAHPYDRFDRGGGSVWALYQPYHM